MDFIVKIKNLREDSEYSQEYLAHCLGTSQTMYSRYELGKSELPVRHLITLCKLYHVSADYLLGLSDSPDKTYKKKNQRKPTK